MIKVAKTAVFCYGVKRAVDNVYAAVEKGIHTATIGPVIHNPQVIEDLTLKGVKVCHAVSDIPDGYTAVIRAHGVPESVYNELKGREYIDLTCPFVAKIHRIVNEHYKKGYKIVIVGDKNHPEVIGINGWCGNEAYIINNTDEKIDENLSQSDVCVVAQTTIKKENFMQIVQILKNTCKSTLIFDTICSATRDRQEEAVELAKASDMVLVIGGRESSNTRKLFEISKQYCKETYQI